MLLPEFDRLHELGFNIVRLLLIWKAIEPTPDPNPETLLPQGEAYLQCIKKIINVLWDRGIYVIIDFHQDLAHEIYGGEGFSDFAVSNEKGMPKSPFDIDNLLPWQLQYMLNSSLQSAMTKFWLDYAGQHKPRTHLEKTIGAAARFFQLSNDMAGHPGILGYELFNEPRSFLFGRTKFEKEILPQYYRNAVEEIRKSVGQNPGDKTSFIFVEPVIDTTIRSRSFDDSELLKIITPEESQLDLSGISSEPIVYSFHYYDPLLFIPGPKDIDDRIQQWKNIFPQLCAQAKKRNAIPFMTEFGVDHGMINHFSIELPHFYENFMKKITETLHMAPKDKHRMLDPFSDILKEVMAAQHTTEQEKQTILDHISDIFKKAKNQQNTEQGKRTMPHEPVSEIVGKVMEAQYKLVEENLLNATYWNYNFYNTDKDGDCCNHEDFSILGPDRKLRFQEIVARPYPMCSSAMPTLLKFDVKTRQCVMKFSGPPVNSPTVIYVPNTIHYRAGFDVYLTSQEITFDKENHILLWWPQKDSTNHQIILCPPGKFEKDLLPHDSFNLYLQANHYRLEFRRD